MNRKKTILLGIGFVVLCGFSFWINHRSKPQVETPKITTRVSAEEQAQQDALKTTTDFLTAYYTYETPGDNQDEVLSYLSGNLKKVLATRLQDQKQSSADQLIRHARYKDANVYYHRSSPLTFDAIAYVSYQYDVVDGEGAALKKGIQLTATHKLTGQRENKKSDFKITSFEILLIDSHPLE